MNARSTSHRCAAISPTTRRWRALAAAAAGAVLMLLVATTTPPVRAQTPPAQTPPAPTTVTFNYTGGPQTWTVPAGITQAIFTVYGASGGANWSDGSRGRGGRATALLLLTPGQTITIMVGEQGLGYDFWGGQARPATFNGGGAGGYGGFFGALGGGSGGGASDVRIGGTDLTHRLLVAGGGGGDYVAGCGSTYSGKNVGGAGGGLTGSGPPCNAQPCRFPPCGEGAAGGNQDGTRGSGQLGRGSDGVPPTDRYYGGGGGGGGYYGGAGGGADWRTRGAGGGGSGHGPAGTTFENGVHEGHGRVIVSWSNSPPPAITGISPRSGPAAGGTTVTITGTNLSRGPENPTSVTFGGTPATAVNCTTILQPCTATSPPGTGTVSVRVTVAGQTSADTPADDFTYAGTPPPVASCNGVPATIVVMQPNQVTNGTSGRDVIVGTSGPDTINGLGGDDLICGGGGADAINGGDGDDTVYGEAGADVVDGGGGNDTLSGGDHGDTLSGGFGNDTLNSDAGNDQLFGEAGDDRLYGGPGNDRLEDTEGMSQTFDGGTGTNTCIGTSTAQPSGSVANCQGATQTPALGAGVAARLTALEAAAQGAGLDGAGLAGTAREARQAVEAGQPLAACGLLQGFIGPARTFGATGLLSQPQATGLSADAAAIRAALSCG